MIIFHIQTDYSSDYPPYGGDDKSAFIVEHDRSNKEDVPICDIVPEGFRASPDQFDVINVLGQGAFGKVFQLNFYYRYKLIHDFRLLSFARNLAMTKAPTTR